MTWGLEQKTKPGHIGGKRRVTAMMSLKYSSLAWKKALQGNKNQRINLPYHLKS